MDINKLEPQVIGNGKNGFAMILMGETGVGKSSLASKLGKKVLSLDCEGTADLISDIYRIPVNNYEEIVEYKKQFLQSDYDTIVFDGGRNFELMVEEFVARKLGRLTYSAQYAKYGDIYQMKREIFSKFFTSLLGRGKNVVVITHISEVEKVDPTTDETYLQLIPNIKDKDVKESLPALFPMVGILEAIKVEGKDMRRLDVIPSKERVCKNRYNIKEQLVADNTDLLAKDLLKRIEKFYKGDGKK